MEKNNNNNTSSALACEFSTDSLFTVDEPDDPPRSEEQPGTATFRSPAERSLFGVKLLSPELLPTGTFALRCGQFRCAAFFGVRIDSTTNFVLVPSLHATNPDRSL